MLADNIIYEILLNSDINDISKICQSCCATTRVCNNDRLWKYLVQRDFPTYKKGLLKGTWRDTYEFLYGPYYQVNYENRDIGIDQMTVVSNFERAIDFVIKSVFDHGIIPNLYRRKPDINDFPADIQSIIVNAEKLEQISETISPEYFTQYSNRLKQAIQAELIDNNELDINTSPWIRYMIYRADIIW